MATQNKTKKKKTSRTVPADVLAAARQRASRLHEELRHKPSPSELLTAEELADAAPYYLVLRDYIRQLKEARMAAGLTLTDVATRTGMAVEYLSRLEAGTKTNPTWKTLASYAAAVQRQPRLVLQALR